MVTLNIPLFTWCVIAFAMVALIIIRVCYKNYSQIQHQRHLIEFGKESEEIFIPGDRLEGQEVYDDED
ncbi:hypothetical protein [Duncaniella sp.]|uniref:hypothetical protein n=1 Tax=Duncaniella sp. TaxID=2518496 RepID=UPI0023D5B853|nr:hypothetical protein [Duncaniella sp.]MDE5905507.1 hypothetical protein [Duncaniella sp.]